LNAEVFLEYNELRQEVISKNKRKRQEAADTLLQKAVGNAVDTRGNCSIMWTTFRFLNFFANEIKKSVEI